MPLRSTNIQRLTQSPISMHPHVQLVPPAQVGIDALLKPAIKMGRCHEIYAGSLRDAAATTGLALGIVAGWRRNKPLLWVRQEMVRHENGMPYAPGLVDYGLDPADIILVTVRDVTAALQAGLEGSRSSGLGGVCIELWGRAPAYDLTASRRLSLACKTSGISLLVTRFAAEPVPSAAETRWQAASSVSRPLAANAPGHATFSLTLLRHRASPADSAWRLEWNRDERRFIHHPLRPPVRTAEFRPPLSGRVVPVSFG